MLEILRRSPKVVLVVAIAVLQLPLALLVGTSGVLSGALGHIPVCHYAPWQMPAAIGLTLDLGDCGHAVLAEETPEEVLKPGGVLIGRPGSGSAGPEVREVPGGLPKAEEIYTRLHRGGAVNTPPGYDGEGRDVPSGGWVGLRPRAEGSPAVDVNVPSVPEIGKIHFPET